MAWGTVTRRTHRASVHAEKLTPSPLYHTGPKMAISPSIIAFLGMSMREDIYAKEQSCTCTRLTRVWPKMDPQEVDQGYKSRMGMRTHVYKYFSEYHSTAGHERA